MIFDDISDQFTGIGKTYTMKSSRVLIQLEFR
jgi:hypothetical protein